MMMACWDTTQCDAVVLLMPVIVVLPLHITAYRFWFCLTQCLVFGDYFLMAEKKLKHSVKPSIEGSSFAL